ncbi:GDSL esterase/lipase At5g55050-like [Lolium rigidum]|uniref:GDSL esterase/lipase At5g55050-like n=1 Tax=Lolium rigidum TaxID=89674 RepID=UPI001F5CAF04|nr:GDSL esterase/lipase At5g55050-like [Lolium rigidum]
MGYGQAMKQVLVAVLAIISIRRHLVAAAGDAVQPSSKALKQVPAMYVFGDSTLDVGNNYLEGADVPRANTPLHGVDYPGSKPTGRFSNGYNIADSIAKKLGLKESPPAYLSLAQGTTPLVVTALTEGVSYASAGAGILDSTHAGDNIPLSKQVMYFESTKAKMQAKVGSAAVRILLSRSFFLISVGSNDLFVFAAAPTDVVALYSSLISGYNTTITSLYNMGARKFGILNVGLLGCVPTVRVLNSTGACNDGLNLLAAGFDDALKSLLASLAAKLPGLVYSLADFYSHTEVTFANPQASGYVNIDSACCGNGRLGAESDCLPNSSLCGDHDKFVFWDRVHPSQRAGELSAAAFYDGPAEFTAPINFKQLARKI